MLLAELTSRWSHARGGRHDGWGLSVIESGEFQRSSPGGFPPVASAQTVAFLSLGEPRSPHERLDGGALSGWGRTRRVRGRGERGRTSVGAPGSFGRNAINRATGRGSPGAEENQQ